MGENFTFLCQPTKGPSVQALEIMWQVDASFYLKKSRWDYQLTYLNHAQKSYKPAYNACTRIVPNGTIRGFFIFRSKPNKGLLPHAKIIPLKRQSRTWDTNALENSGANNRPAPRGWSLATNPIRLPGVFGIIASLSVKTPREKSFWGFLFSKRLKQEEE
jgi:hypothetical protein